MEETMSTKERIAQVALRLFSQKGFAAVSIRDICGEVGIRESTIYYHFANKQAILELLLERVVALAEQKKARFDRAFARAETVSSEQMQQVAVFLLTDYLLHPDVQSLLCLLSMERMHNESAQRAYLRIVFELPLAQQEKVFAQMQARGLIGPGDARAVAELYYGAVYAAWQQHCLGCAQSGDALRRASEQISRDVAALYETIRRKEP